jgi:hypothetical protein
MQRAALRSKESAAAQRRPADKAGQKIPQKNKQKRTFSPLAPKQQAASHRHRTRAAPDAPKTGPTPQPRKHA